MKQKFRFTAEPRSALCLLSMALMLLSAAARLWYYLADPVATAMTLSQADIFLLVGLPVFSAALYPVLLARRAGAEALGVPSYTHDRAFYCLMLAREVCGVWFTLLF